MTIFVVKKVILGSRIIKGQSQCHKAK